MRFDQDPIKKAKKGNTRKLTVGGQVFVDKDYSKLFKNSFTKNIVILLFLLPLLAILAVLWLWGLKLMSVVIMLATALIGYLFWYLNNRL